jgi:hypothetical protein
MQRFQRIFLLPFLASEIASISAKDGPSDRPQIGEVFEGSELSACWVVSGLRKRQPIPLLLPDPFAG